MTVFNMSEGFHYWFASFSTDYTCLAPDSSTLILELGVTFRSAPVTVSNVTA